MQKKIIKIDKEHTFLQILYYLMMIIFLTVCYETTYYKYFFYMELVTVYMIFMTVFQYILKYKYKPQNRAQEKILTHPKATLDKEFKKNYTKTNNKYKQETEVPDLKSSYIQSVWDEMNK